MLEKLKLVEARYLEMAERAAQPTNYTGKTLELYQEALSKGLIDGSRPKSYATRQEVALIVNKAASD